MLYKLERKVGKMWFASVLTFSSAAKAKAYAKSWGWNPHRISEVKEIRYGRKLRGAALASHNSKKSGGAGDDSKEQAQKDGSAEGV